MKWSTLTLGAALVLPTLGGCAAFSWDEAESVAKTNNQLNLAAFSSLMEDWAAAKKKSTTATLDWEQLEDGWAFSGSLSSDGPHWTGAMGFDGSLVGDEDSAEWTLGVDYDQATVDTTTLDGSMDWRWTVEVTTLSDFHMEYQVTGEITASGDVVGTGAMDYLATIDVSGGSASFEVSGKVGGQPVDFSFTLNLGWL